MQSPERSFLYLMTRLCASRVVRLYIFITHLRWSLFSALHSSREGRTVFRKAAQRCRLPSREIFEKWSLLYFLAGDVLA